MEYRFGSQRLADGSSARRRNESLRLGMRTRVTVSIIEENSPGAASLSCSLKKARALRVLAAYPSVEAALKKAPLNPPDLLLIDLDLSQRSVLAGLRRLKAGAVGMKIAVLTGDHEIELVLQAFRAGADGWFLKKESAAQLAQDIRALVHGGSPISTDAAKKLVLNFQAQGQRTAQTNRLTIREREIMEHLSHGLSDKEMATLLRIALPTVNDHLKSVYRKLHVHSRTEAVAKRPNW